ncbi:MAG: hypothetical protein ACR2QC_04725 [Gammaproteobacteria bacterium]
MYPPICAFGVEIPAFAGMGRKENAIPANAGISFAERRIRRLRFRARRFRLSPEWRFFYVFGYRQIRHCPQKQKAPPFRRKPESLSCVAGILP